MGDAPAHKPQDHVLTPLLSSSFELAPYTHILITEMKSESIFLSSWQEQTETSANLKVSSLSVSSRAFNGKLKLIYESSWESSLPPLYESHSMNDQSCRVLKTRSSVIAQNTIFHTILLML